MGLSWQRHQRSRHQQCPRWTTPPFRMAPNQPPFPPRLEATGWDGTILFTPNDNMQIVLSASVNSSVKLTNKGQWIKYPVCQDKWATWYFRTAGSSEKARRWPQPTPIRTIRRPHQHWRLPRGRHAEEPVHAFANYKFGGSRKGWIVGAGGNWASSAPTSPALPTAATKCRPTPPASRSSSTCRRSCS